MEKGKFIVIEGPDGVGKTTQSKLLCQFLQSKGIKYIYTREPGGTPIGDYIRELLLNPENKIVPIAECLLYASARAQLIEEVIKPALSKGYWVISDRYLHSSIVYQGIGLNLGHNLVEEINIIATGGLMPDYTFLIDLDTDIALSRIGRTKDRIESRGLDYFQKVREGYHKLLNEYNMILIDGNKDIEEIHREIISKLKF
ncbi:dTMP kinase [Anaerobranca californiensis DSM 14826]|jgi:dTMP kinase|uniref:Thymidylate kinase n=1 Tax=Anaerobranca californiensis DSM 14826 TaxID=1120989 RepID=A0A1M6PLN4_9FIRM|nr:dTMP kinase [Anaerobranca californiensis]SHK08906.1 dTMP kinase [Anaerobranca californiensis DSM 14826]